MLQMYIVQCDTQNNEHWLLPMVDYGCSYAGLWILNCCSLWLVILGILLWVKKLLPPQQELEFKPQHHWSTAVFSLLNLMSSWNWYDCALPSGLACQLVLKPAARIMWCCRDEDRDRHELLKSSSSEESMRRRASSSNDSVLSSGISVSTHNSPLTGISSATWPDPELTRRSVVAEPTHLIALPTQEVLETTV